jgi:hypothetical protein
MPRTPADLARRVALSVKRAEDAPPETPILWNRETFRLPRAQAGETARAWLERYPESAYRSRIESWRLLDNGLVEFTLRRLPQAG